MTLVEKINESLQSYGITYTTEQITAFIDNAKALVDSPLLEVHQYTDYVKDYEGEVYCTDFYPVLDVDMVKVGDREVTLSHISPNGVLYFEYPHRGTLSCTYTVGLTDDELEDDLLPLVVAMIRDKEGQNISSITEGDVSVTYNNSTGNSVATLDSLVANLRDKYSGMVRLV